MATATPRIAALKSSCPMPAATAAKAPAKTATSMAPSTPPATPVHTQKFRPAIPRAAAMTMTGFKNFTEHNDEDGQHDRSSVYLTTRWPRAVCGWFGALKFFRHSVGVFNDQLHLGVGRHLQLCRFELMIADRQFGNRLIGQRYASSEQPHSGAKRWFQADRKLSSMSGHSRQARMSSSEISNAAPKIRLVR